MSYEFPMADPSPMSVPGPSRLERAETEVERLQAEVERLRGALTRINVLADPYRESEAWASPEAYSRWAAQIASEALNG